MTGILGLFDYGTLEPGKGRFCNLVIQIKRPRIQKVFYYRNVLDSEIRKWNI